MDTAIRQGSQMHPMDRLMRPAEAAQVLGISRSKTYQLLQRGELPAVRVGTSVRVPALALDRWIAARTAEPRDAA